jgi:hypothetical protein
MMAAMLAAAVAALILTARYCIRKEREERADRRRKFIRMARERRINRGDRRRHSTVRPFRPKG